LPPLELGDSLVQLTHLQAHLRSDASQRGVRVAAADVQPLSMEVKAIPEVRAALLCADTRACSH